MRTGRLNNEPSERSITWVVIDNTLRPGTGEWRTPFFGKGAEIRCLTPNAGSTLPEIPNVRHLAVTSDGWEQLKLCIPNEYMLWK